LAIDFVDFQDYYGDVKKDKKITDDDLITKKYLNKVLDEKIEITKTHTIKYAPEIDVTYIQTDDKHDYISAEENYSENDDVKNIGYPTRFTKEIFGDFKIKKQFSADGSILKIKKDYSMNANDVKISNKEVLILNYSSEEGFSGGPLLKGEKVVGIMSHLYPHNRNAIAVSIKEVKNTLVAG